MKNWRNEKTELLFEALLIPKNTDQMAALCRDLMTVSEIEEFAGRLQVAKALDAGMSQRKVAESTGVSIATVTRVNLWLQKGMDGYKLVLFKLKKLKPSLMHHHPH